MTKRNTLLAAVIVVVLGAVAVFPSWRSYYLPRGTVTIVEDQVYIPGSTHPRHQLDWYVPTTQMRPWPVVVFIHGGFWKPFDRRLFQPVTGLHGGVGVALANHGVVTAVVGYRQTPEARIADALEDLARALAFVRAHAAEHGGDPGRVFVMGHSAGALMTSLLGADPSWLAAQGVEPGMVNGFMTLAGVYDLERVIPKMDKEMQPIMVASAGDAAGLTRFSSEKQLHAGMVPWLLLVGSKDTPPLLEEHAHMERALRAAGSDVTAVTVEGEDHMDVVMHLSNASDRTLAAVLGFIQAH